MSNFIIVIPSYKRSEILFNKPNTLDYINELLMKNTFLAIRVDEIKKYQKVFDKYNLKNYIAIANDVNGIVGTRDGILDFAYGYEQPKRLITIDDDIKFAYRPYFEDNDIQPNKYIDMDKDYFEAMIENMLNHCYEEYPIVSITPRQFSNTKIKDFDVNARMIQVCCYYIPVMEHENVKYSDANIPFMTDYYFALKYLSLGYKNLSLNAYTKDDSMQSAGGCETYRTPTLITKSAIRLHKLFPNCTSLKWKNNGSFKDDRISISIRWKKAFNEKAYNERHSVI